MALCCILCYLRATVRIDMVTTVMYMTTTNSQTMNHKDKRLRFSAVGYMETQDHWQAHFFLYKMYVFMYATFVLH